jgi:hypothetical protein
LTECAAVGTGTAFAITEGGRWLGIWSGIIHFQYIWKSKRLAAAPCADANDVAASVFDMHGAFYERTGELNDPAKKQEKTSAAYVEAHRLPVAAVEADSLPTYTMAELAEHKAYTWLAIRGKVYDVSFWLDKHPGCSSVLKKHAGGDATNIFTAVEHTPSAHAWLRGFLIGTVEG